MVDKNLFLHDLSVVAILKNEAPYLKEWLDYHLLAGVDHFYLYDNESPDNQAEIAAPYVEAGLVDYFSAPGKAMQYVVYNDAVKRFKFQSRYLTFIDGDEFIFPKTNQSIAEVTDEILLQDENASGLEINWQIFGSNGHDKADYTRGVLERFTRRALNNEKSNPLCKSIVNARTVNIMTPHCASYFEEFYAVNSNNEFQKTPGNIRPLITDKIVVNHYHCKSLEEYRTKKERGIADKVVGTNYSDEQFKGHDCNEEFDDGILKYRAVRAENFRLPDKSCADERLLNALMKNLSPVLLPNTPPEFYAEKMETFLTCRAVAAYLKPRITNTVQANFFEETSIVAILRTLSSGASFGELQIFLRELPNLLRLPYPVVKELREATLQMIAYMIEIMHFNNMWKDYVELDYLRDLLRE